MKTILRKGGEKVRTTNYIVKSIGFDFKTHECYGISYEKINLINNSLFNECKNEFHIENNYENFWNRLNPIKSGWYKNNRVSIVKVLEVYPLEEFISEFPKEYNDMVEGTSPLNYGKYPVETDYPKKKNKLSQMLDGFINKVRTLLNFKMKSLTIKYLK